jgi:SAM-dependent methyltransferase
MWGRAVASLFAVTAFFGAGMLFLVQPMIARLLLPSYGGSATVWSTSSLFFQVVLLLGYLYSDRATRLARTPQRLVHGLVLLTPLLVLPLALPTDAAPHDGTSPILWLLRTLLLVIGLPFAVLATTGPLLQRWYSWSGRTRADDPYFLFAASNFGSFVGLLGYPFLIEPRLSVHSQLHVWSLGFGIFIVLTATCMLLPAAKSPYPGGAVSGHAPAEQTPSSPVPIPAAAPLTWKRLLRWTGLAFLPSALMLAVTSHISTDIAAIPLLWVVPLAIYLASFVAAFGRTSRRPLVRTTRVAVFAAVIASLSAVVNVAHQPIVVAVGVQVGMLALVAFAAHARLAADRPEPARLTTFYLVVAVGGALGGLLNGVVAPLLFDRVLEYPLVIVSVPLLLVGLSSADRMTADALERYRVRLLAVSVGLLVPAAAVALATHGAPVVSLLLALLGCGFLAWAMTRAPLVLCAVLVVAQVALLVISDNDVIDRRRTFYGSLSTKAEDGQHRLYDGTTLHGTQYVGSRSTDPTTYYSRSGPLGDVLGLSDYRHVAVVGLGAGTVAAYGHPGETMTFYEINPAVVAVARDPHLFTYLRDSRAHVRVVQADGRLGLESAPRDSYDLIALDAFSSDSIPVHLLTREAVEMYASRLRPGGLLVFHISNNTFDLRPVLRADADALGWAALVGSRDGEEPGATPSTWVVLARTRHDLRDLPRLAGWSTLPPRTVTWTDDYSSVLRVLR